MFALAWIFLPDLPAYRTGLIVVGLARCIAMVIIWNDLACGDREAAAVLVALNSVFQVIAFAALGWFYLSVLPGWLGLEQTSIDASPWDIARSVLIFLGIPLVAGFLSRRIGEKRRGREWYESTFIPRVAPWALYGLLFTIVILFALQGEAITVQPARRRAHRGAAARLLRPDVGWRLRARGGARPRLRADGHARLHGGRQQLRARHRSRHRDLRGRLRSGPGGRRRPAHRGACPRGARLRQPRAPRALHLGHLDRPTRPGR